MGTKKKRYVMIYIIMLALVFIITLAVNIENKGISLVTVLAKDNISFSSGWVTSDETRADLKHLGDITEPYEWTSIYNTFPEDLPEGFSLCFRSKNIYYEVYIDGELRYTPEVPESTIYTDSLGTRWNYIVLSTEDAGKQVEIRFETVYESATACVDHIYIGNAAGHVLNIFSEKMVAFITCLLLLFASIILIIADIPINMGNHKSHELLYLGLFSFCIAMWSLVETNLLQFFTNDSRLLQVISCTSLILVPIPLLLYLDEIFEFHVPHVIPVMYTLSVLEFTACMVLHFTGIMDFHQTLKFSHVVLGLSAIILIIVSVENMFIRKKKEEGGIYTTLRVIGFLAIALTCVIDLIRYYIGGGGDSAMFVRIGLLIFVLCYGFSSLQKTVDAVKLGIQSEFISQLAYKDGLTGIGNRTAFKERIADLEKSKTGLAGVGIVMFDVNDLKYVNDNYGHQIGDILLVNSAELIKKSWDRVAGKCYRIGGDEFAVILCGDDAAKRCEKGSKIFKDEIAAYNAEESHTFTLSIAFDYAIYSKGSSTTIMDVFNTADEKMYENKKKIKEARSRMEPGLN